MVLQALDKVEAAISQLKAALKELDAVCPSSSELVVQAIHDRCKDTDNGKFRLHDPAEYTEVAREQIEKSVAGQRALAGKLPSVERKVFGLSICFYDIKTGNVGATTITSTPAHLPAGRNRS